MKLPHRLVLLLVLWCAALAGCASTQDSPEASPSSKETDAEILERLKREYVQRNRPPKNEFFCAIPLHFDKRMSGPMRKPELSAAPANYLFQSRRPDVDQLLSRPYDATVPFGGSGDRLWATSPQGFGFNDGIHFVYINNFVPFTIKIPGFKPGNATYYPSHVHVEGVPGHEFEATASFTFAIDGADRPLTKPFVPEKRWTCWNSKHREDWYAVDFGGEMAVKAATLYFFADAPGGGCRAPENVKIEYWVNSEWKEAKNVKNEKGEPAPGGNRFVFDEVKTGRLRFLFKNRGENYYTGLYGVDPELTMVAESNTNKNLQISTDKFITNDDVLGVLINIKNIGDAPATFVCEREYPSVDTREAGLANWNQPSAPIDSTDILPKLLNMEMHAVCNTVVPREKAGACKIETRFRSVGHPTSIQLRLAAGESTQVAFLCGIHEDLRTALERSEKYYIPILNSKFNEKEFYNSQISPLNSNLANFDCPDPFVTKEFWHRGYLIKKNFMNPKIGALQDYCCSEGRWASTWYHNVISYGAGHQIREARWIADPNYSWGQLNTFCKNPRPDGIFPSHITPEGQKGGQYTDWISSTALDVMAVHPDISKLQKVMPALVKNAHAWIDVYDKDNDFLPVVDSHWWTGMEWQPSFFYFNNYLPKKGEDDLERVDLAAYAYGDAKNVAECARLLNNTKDAAELDALSQNIKNAVQAKLWNRDWQYFLSNRFQDDKPALVKEEIGVYPYYFGLPDPGKGFEAAWNSIIDPKEMWGPWPVRSCSKKCEAYAPGVFWPVGENVATACMWNGPTWPHANSIIMTAMARTLRDYPPCNLKKSHLFELFNSFTKVQFKNQDIRYPWTGEFYHAESGEWLTGERDYNHSTWLDILIPEICGLVPSNSNVLTIDPLLPAVEEGGWTHFLLDGQKYRGHNITIIWDAPDGKRPYGTQTDTGVKFNEGLTVFVDGRLAAERPTLGKLVTELR